jgi:hypothetical protein
VTTLFGEEEEYGARGREGYRGEIGLEVDQRPRERRVSRRIRQKRGAKRTSITRLVTTTN